MPVPLGRANSPSAEPSRPRVGTTGSSRLRSAWRRGESTPNHLVRVADSLSAKTAPRKIHVEFETDRIQPCGQVCGIFLRVAGADRIRLRFVTRTSCFEDELFA